MIIRHSRRDARTPDSRRRTSFRYGGFRFHISAESHPFESKQPILPRFITGTRGASLVEYGLLSGLIAVASIAAVNATGGSVGNLFSTISGSIDASSTGGAEQTALGDIVSEAPPSGSYLDGDLLSYAVTFNEPVYASGGTPSIPLEIDGQVVDLPLTSGSGSTTLTFEAPLPTGLSDGDGFSVSGGAIALNGAELAIGSGDPAQTALSGDMTSAVAGDFPPSFEGISAAPVQGYQGESIDPATISFSDVNGDALTLTMNGTLPTGLSFVDNGDGTGTITGTPAAAGTTTGLSVSASDGDDIVASDAFSIDIGIRGKIVDSSPTAWGSFGWSVDMTSDVAVIGTRADRTLLYDLATPDSPIEYQLPVPPAVASGDGFGEAVAVDGGYALVGAHGRNEVFVYDVSQPDSPSLLGVIAPPSGASVTYFGRNLDIDGNRAVVVAQYDSAVTNIPGTSVGPSFYVYDLSTPSSPQYQGFAYPSSPDNWGGGLREIALEGDTVVWGNGSHGDATGIVYLFDLQNPANPAEVASFQAPTPSLDEVFGFDVAISGGIAAIGQTESNGGTDVGPGRVHLYDVSDASNPAHVDTVTLAPTHGMQFGRSVALANGRLISGAAEASSGRGAVGIYDVSPSGLATHVETFMAPDGEAGDRLGFSVATNGLESLATAIYADHSSLTSAGSAYLRQ